MLVHPVWRRRLSALHRGAPEFPFDIHRIRGGWFYPDSFNIQVRRMQRMRTQEGLPLDVGKGIRKIIILATERNHKKHGGMDFNPHFPCGLP